MFETNKASYLKATGIFEKPLKAFEDASRFRLLFSLKLILRFNPAPWCFVKQVKLLKFHCWVATVITLYFYCRSKKVEKKISSNFREDLRLTANQLLTFIATFSHQLWLVVFRKKVWYQGCEWCESLATNVQLLFLSNCVSLEFQAQNSIIPKISRWCRVIGLLQNYY